MSYQMVLKAGVTGNEKSATFLSTGGSTVILAGTGFKYDDDGYLKAGTITKMTYMTSDFGGTEKAQVVTLKKVSAADLYHDLLSPALNLVEKTSDWAKTDDVESFGSTKIVLEMDDFTKVVIRGTGFIEDPIKGKVTSLEHLDVNGHRLEKINDLKASLSATMTALGESGDIYNYLTRGENKITNYTSFPPRLEGGLGNDTLDGGSAPFAVAEYLHTAIAGINANLGTGLVTGGAGKDSLIHIASVSGSNFNDVLTGKNSKDGTFGDTLWGNGGKDKIDGLGGNDYLYGNAGNDTIKGGAGDDKIAGGTGNDKLDGGKGVDILAFDGELLGKKGVTVHLAQTGVQDFGAWGKDAIVNFEGVYGSDFADRIIGTKGNDMLIGNGGSDVLRAGDGNDTLYAQGGPGGGFTNLAGNDKLYGGAGKDTLYSGMGVDLLVGEAGKDTFVFAGLPQTYFKDVDIIKDFEHKIDTIKLASSSFFELEAGKVSKSHFVLGTAAKDDNDHLIYDQKTGNLYYDDDGKGGDVQHLLLTLVNKADLSASDFLIY